MKSISLARKPEKLGKTAMSEMATPKETYPSFTIYDNAPEELMKYDNGKEFTAKIRQSMIETRKEGGKDSNKVGYEILSIEIDDTNSKVDAARAEGKKIAETVIKKKE